jgi:hypothetical protein
MSASEMFEIEAVPFNGSFSGKRSATRESLFERSRELSRTPTEAANRDSRLKAGNDSRREMRSQLLPIPLHPND